MKRIKQALVILLTAILAATAVPVQSQAAARISATNKTLDVGKSFNLKVYGASSKVKWSSSNKKVATVTKKGKVTGKQEGTATIKAKVAKKTLKCKVTVQSNFSTSTATKNISCTLQDTGKGVVAILKNNNSTTVSVSAKMVYYSGGKMIDTSSDYNYGFESDTECALFFHAPTDSNYNDVSYDDYKISLSVDEASSSTTYSAKRIEVSSNIGSENVTAEIKNKSEKDLEFIYIAVVFYDSQNKAIGYEYTYAKCETGGSVDFVSFDFPHDSNYNAITPSSYKIYVNHAY